jgi:hypothetical protein
MGRHSAPDDDGAVVDVVVAPPPSTRPRPGRHARPDDDDRPAVEAPEKPAPKPRPRDVDEAAVELADVASTGAPLADAALADQVTERIGTLDDVLEADELPTEPVPTPEAKPEPRVGKGNQSTAADLALLRERSDVRARVIAAIVVPFVLYTAVLYAASAMHVYFIWVWIPLVTAGVLAGSILDAAHRRRGTTRS